MEAAGAARSADAVSAMSAKRMRVLKRKNVAKVKFLENPCPRAACHCISPHLAATLGCFISSPKDHRMHSLFRTALSATAGFVLFTAPALAQPCASNFKVDGVPMVTGLSYRTWDLVPDRQPAAVLKDLAAAVSAEGFADMRIDKPTSAVVAIQESTGSGRPQTLRITARKNGKGTRIDAVFVVQAGQVAPEDYVRKAFCRVIDGARS